MPNHGIYQTHTEEVSRPAGNLGEPSLRLATAALYSIHVQRGIFTAAPRDIHLSNYALAHSARSSDDAVTERDCGPVFPHWAYSSRALLPSSLRPRRSHTRIKAHFLQECHRRVKGQLIRSETAVGQGCRRLDILSRLARPRSISSPLRSRV